MPKKKLKHRENDIFLEDVDIEGSVYEGYEAETEPQKRKKKRRRWPFVLLFLLIAVAAVLMFNNFRTGRNWTIAVFGVDSRGTELESGTRSDVIMVVNVDRLTGEVRLCSVFRDTYLKVSQDGDYAKINAAYERGGHEQAIAALEENLDIKIDDYVTFSWGTVAKAINLLGGVDIEITDAEFRYINAFITETVEATGIASVQLQSPGWNHLDGVQAVAYGRLRLMDTDFQRTARQRKVLSLMLDKAKIAEKSALINMATSLIGEVSTSVGIDDILPVVATVARFDIPEDGSSGFPFSRQTEDIGSQNYVIPTTLESNVVMLHQFLFGDEDYEAPQSVKDISARISADSGLSEAGEAAAVPQVGGNAGEAPATQPASSQTETQDEGVQATEAQETETSETMEEQESETDGSLEEQETTDSEENETSEATEDSSDEETSEGSGMTGAEETETVDKEEESKEEETSSTEGPAKPVEGPGSGDMSMEESISQLDKDTPVVIESQAGPGAAASEDPGSAGPGASAGPGTAGAQNQGSAGPGTAAGPGA